MMTDEADFLPNDEQLTAVIREIDFDADETLAKLKNDYQQTREELSATHYAQESGISVSAFSTPDELNYQPNTTFPSMLRMGTLEPLYSAELNEKLGDIPYYHNFSEAPHLLVNLPEHPSGNTLLQNIALRLLASLEPQLVKLHCIDAAELGRAFTDLTELSSSLRPQRVLTETSDIEQLLKTLKAHSVSLVQDILGNRYDDLQTYNDQAGDMTESYQFLFIANFPQGFSPAAQSLLLSLLDNATQTGLSIFISVNHEAQSQHQELLDTLIKHPHLAVLADGNVTNVEGADFFKEQFTIEPEISITPKANTIISGANQQAGQIKPRTVQTNLPEQPFTESSSNGINIPIGQTGRGTPCSVQLGADDSPHHGLVGGTAGSGKSVLLHNLILNGAWLYSPDELEFLLLDYREGVEFIPYQTLPHVKVLAIESSRTFGLNVLEYLQQEMVRRGDLFKKAGVGKLAEYRQQTDLIMPRLLLIIDEFHVLLKGNDNVSRQAAELLDDIARRGRGFGIHMILSSQTLMHVDIQESTLSNIRLRIGLQMSENDAARIFHRDNTAASSLRKQGEAYLNNTHGQHDGNIRLQVAWLSPEDRQKTIKQLGLDAGERDAARYIFTGEDYAELTQSLLPVQLSQPTKPQSRFADALIASPAYISDQPINIRLRRQIASNILLIGHEADACGIMLLMLHQYIRQSTTGSMIGIANLLTVDSPNYDYLDVLHEQHPEQVTSIDNAGLEATLENLSNALEQRTNDHSKVADRIILCITNVQNARCFKRTGGGLGVPTATKQLETLIHEGGQYGIHVLLYCQRYQDFHDLFQSPSMLLGDFENRIALYGGNSEKVLPLPQTTVPKAGVAHIYSPQARYEIDPAYLYHPDSIINLFADL